MVKGLGITVLIVQVTNAIAMAGMSVAIAQTVATMSAKVRAVDTMAMIVIATACQCSFEFRRWYSLLFPVPGG